MRVSRCQYAGLLNPEFGAIVSKLSDLDGFAPIRRHEGGPGGAGGLDLSAQVILVRGRGWSSTPRKRPKRGQMRGQGGAVFTCA